MSGLDPVSGARHTIGRVGSPVPELVPLLPIDNMCTCKILQISRDIIRGAYTE